MGIRLSCTPGHLKCVTPFAVTVWYEEINQGVDTLHKLTYIIG